MSAYVSNNLRKRVWHQQHTHLSHDNTSHKLEQRSSILCTPWQVAQPGRKLRCFERHLMTRVSSHFALFTKGGKTAVNSDPWV